MTGLEALDFFKNINKRQNNGNGDIWLEMHIKAIEKELKALEIIKRHKLLNYVLKNPKCARMYHLSDNDIIRLKEEMK
jgi:hypothetical protein